MLIIKDSIEKDFNYYFSYIICTVTSRHNFYLHRFLMNNQREASIVYRLIVVTPMKKLSTKNLNI